jgi:hypothetical protein
MSFAIVLLLYVFFFVSFCRNQYGRAFLSLTGASVLLVVSLVLPLVAAALSAAAH